MTHITIERTKLEKALAALKRISDGESDDPCFYAGESLEAIEQALAAPTVQEPVGFMNAGNILEMQQGRLPYGYVYPKGGSGASVPIYTTPPAAPVREPLGFISQKQACLIKDPEDDSGVYIPMRKTLAGNFDCPVYTTPPAAQPAPVQEPVAWPTVDEFAKHIRWINGSYKRGAGSLAESLLEWLKAKTLCATPPAAPVQEPVAYWIPKAEQFCIANPSGRPFAKAWEPLYTFPPAQRTWVGLTDEDLAQCVQATVESGEALQLMACIEAKLKEKNNGN